MKYPEWAPVILVERHKSRMDSDSSERKFKRGDPDTIVAEFEKWCDGLVEKENIENYRRFLHHSLALGPPDEETTVLLDKMITKPMMEAVWKSLARRIKEDIEFSHFFDVCEISMYGWRGAPRRTKEDQKKLNQEIHGTAEKLLDLIKKSGEFDFYSMSDLIGDLSIYGLMDALDTQNELSYARSCVSNIMPRIEEVLEDISERVIQYREKESSVKKPGSKRAYIHYFVRALSHYLNSKYNQPLHEVVAVTTSVLFDDRSFINSNLFDPSSIDSDYVRKLVG